MAIMVEEGTTNLISNPDVEADTTGWVTQTYRGSGNFSRAADAGYPSGYGLKIEATADNSRLAWVSPSFSVTAGITYTVSVWMRVPTWVATNTSRRIGSVIAPALDGVGTYSWLYSTITPSTEWTRITATFTPTASFTANIRLWAEYVNTGTVAQFDRLQVEQKPYATSFIDGTRSPEILTIPTAGVLADRGPWTIECRAKTDHLGGSHRMPFAAWNKFYVDLNPSDKPQLSWVDANNVQQAAVAANALTNLTEWHYWAFTWDGVTARIYVDAVKVIEVATDLPQPLPSNLTVGWGAGSYNLDGLIDDLRISSRARTDDEILAAYQSGLPLPVDEDTTWKSSFDGHLYNEVPIRKYGLMLKRGTIKLEAPAPDEGIQIYDAQGNLRTHIGQYAPGKYGAKVINGEIYSTSINSGMPGDVNRIELSAGFMPLTVYYNNKAALEMYAVEDGGYLRILNPIRNTPVGWLFGFDDIRGRGIGLEGFSGTGWMPVYIGGSSITLNGGNIDITDDDNYAYVTIDGELMVHGPLYVTGQPKNAIEHTSQGYVALAAVEAPEVLYIDRGIAELINGECRVDLDPLFLECIMPNSEETPWNIFLTPKGPFTLYESEIGDTYFVVKSHDPNANGKFSWILVAVRKGMAGIRLQKVWDDDEVLTSNWEDKLGVTFEDEETENSVG